MGWDADDRLEARLRESEERSEIMAGALDRIADAMEKLLEIQSRSNASVGWLVRRLIIGPAAVVQVGLEPNGDIYLAWGRRQEENGYPETLVEEHASGSPEVVPALIRLVDRVRAWRAQFETDESPF